ncbi:hypothetical protein LNP74_17595 [Klebsiella pneumoniae subsp. pneumoniae]|nr:hypothetical protein [Klebsiella pneumoniae subsp. pneumoniae]
MTCRRICCLEKGGIIAPLKSADRGTVYRRSMRCDSPPSTPLFACSAHDLGLIAARARADVWWCLIPWETGGPRSLRRR